MKKWNAAELVELNIAETAHGNVDFFFEASHNGYGTNNDLVDGKDSDGDGYPTQNNNNNNVTPDTTVRS